MNISRSKEFAARGDMFRRSKRSASVVSRTNRIGSSKPAEKRNLTRSFRDNGYDQVQLFQSRNGSCDCRANGNPEGSSPGANAVCGTFTITPPRYDRRAFSIL